MCKATQKNEEHGNGDRVQEQYLSLHQHLTTDFEKGDKRFKAYLQHLFPFLTLHFTHLCFVQFYISVPGMKMVTILTRIGILSNYITF